MPRLTRMYSLILALNRKIASVKGQHPKKRWSEEEMDALMYESEEGHGIIDTGRVLSEVELLGPNGQLIYCKSMAFSNVEEIRRAASSLNIKGHEQLPVLPPGAPEFFVSVTMSPTPPPKMLGSSGSRNRLVQ